MVAYVYRHGNLGAAIGMDAPTRLDFGVTETVLDVFNSLTTSVNMCMVSNGVLLDRH
jgi:hypothetical protein